MYGNDVSHQESRSFEFESHQYHDSWMCQILLLCNSKPFYAKSYTSFLHYSSWRENVLKSKIEKQRKGNYAFYNCSKSNMHFFECKSYVRFHMYNAVNHIHLRMYFSLLLLSIIILVCHFLLLCLCQFFFSIRLPPLVKPFILFKKLDCNTTFAYWVKKPRKFHISYQN